MCAAADVDQDLAILLGEDWKGGEHRSGERFLDGLFFDRIARGAVIEIAANDENTRAEAFELHDSLVAGGAAI